MILLVTSILSKPHSGIIFARLTRSLFGYKEDLSLVGSKMVHLLAFNLNYYFEADEPNLGLSLVNYFSPLN